MLPWPMDARKLAARLHRSLVRGGRLPICLGLAVSALVLWLHLDPPRGLHTLLTRLDQIVYDQRFALLLDTPEPTEPRVVIVDVDERSLEAEGQWPWSRFKLGDLLSRLAEQGALVVGFDVFFPEYERNVAEEAERRLAQHPQAQALLPELVKLQPLLDGDRYFAERMRETTVALGVFFQRNAALRKGALPPPIADVDAGLAARLILPFMRGYTGNVPELQAGAAGGGFFDTVPDSDGVLRRTPLVRLFDGQLYPSLALEMARLYLFEERFSLQTAALDARGHRQVLTGVRMGPVLLPTDARGQVLLPYPGAAGSFPYVSATDLLHDRLSAEQRALFDNSLVLVGSSATGLFDLRATPLDEAYPGVEVHATVLRAILASLPVLPSATPAGKAVAAPGTPAQAPAFPRRPDYEKGALTLVLASLGLLLAVALPRLGPALLGLSSALLVLAAVLLNFWLWSRFRLDVSLVIVLLLIALLTLVNMSFGFLREGITRRALKNMFEQYVPPAHIDAMLEHPDRYSFAGESRDLTVLFADVRGFTAISESLSASQLKTLLNDYLTPVTGIIFEQQGTVDKYVGDMVMAFWGAPLEDPRHHENALIAALRILERIGQLSADFVARGLPPLDVGIGINSGLMNVGDMGSTYRRSYTVLGDAVNLASRLEGLTKFYGVRCLIGEATHEQLDDWLFRLIDRVQVQGKERSVRIYEPLCRRALASPQLLALLSCYESACAAYSHKDWPRAQALFTELSERDPNSARLYEVYLQRIENLRMSDLPGDWDATFRHTAK